METKPQVGLGEFLRAEREQRQITIEQVASATKINIKLLHSLEADNYDGLPAKPFIRGFVTSYARYIGLEPRDVLSRFEVFLDEKSGKKFKRPENAPHIFVEREGQTDNNKTMLSIVMVGFLVIAVVVFAVVKPSLKRHRGRGKDKTVVSNDEVITVVPPPSENSPILAASTTTTTTPAATPAPTPTPAEPVKVTKKEKEVAKAPEPKPTQVGFIKLPPIPNNEVRHRLVVRAVEDAWVKYQVDDRPLQAYTLRKDKTIFVRARTSIRFTSGKPKALEISYDNKEFQPFGNTARVIIMPKNIESEFKDQPFIAPNPAYLSTPDQ